MDLNELLHAHQVEVMRAGASGDDQGRQGHFEKVALYAERIRQLRESRQRADPPSLPASRETIIYGSYAGDPAPKPAAASLGSWESEGGALDPPRIPLPHGITMTVSREYHVGPHVYSDLSLAIAENERQRLQSNPR